MLTYDDYHLLMRTQSERWCILGACVCMVYYVVQNLSLFLSLRPLHIAARNGLATVVQALLNRGATVLAVDEEGMPSTVCTPNHIF